MNKSSTSSMKDNIMRVPDDLRNTNLPEERLKSLVKLIKYDNLNAENFKLVP